MHLLLIVILTSASPTMMTKSLLTEVSDFRCVHINNSLLF